MPTQQSPKNPKGAISVYPDPELRKALAIMAAELGHAEGRILCECAAAVTEMVESEGIIVPRLVTMLRTLREHKASLLHPPRELDGERRDKREVSFYSEIRAGHPSAVCAEAPPEKITVPANLAKHADFAVKVFGDSMEPMVSEGDVAVFRAAETAGNGQFVAAVVDGQMLLKRFTQKGRGAARLESLNPKYPPIAWTDETRIQGVFEGKFELKH
jgi:SOS-response transcriptional repressor LexA